MMEPRIKANIIRIVSVVSTLLTALELTRDYTNSLVFFALALVALVVSIIYLRKSDGDSSAPVMVNSITAIVSAILVMGCIGYNHWNDRTQRMRYSLWNEIISSSEETDWLKDLADAGDGPAILELANRFLKQNEFVPAREYYRRSALKGSSEAYLTLANLSIQGCGGPVDYPTAVKYIIEAHKRGRVDVESYYNKLKDLGYVFSESEKRSLNRVAEHDDDFSRIVVEDIKGDGGVTSLLKSREWFLKTSDEGFIPSTRALYFAEKENGADSAYVSRLAGLLYDAGITPTDDIERVRFMRYLGKDVSVSERRYAELKRARIFPLSYWDKNRVAEMSSAADSSLLATYSYLLAQYAYYRNLDDNPDARNTFSPEGDRVYAPSRDKAEELLTTCISEIQRRKERVEAKED